MPLVSVAEAAERLGVGVSRVHQRIAEGSLRAERIGSQWAVDELSVLRIAESRRAGRPLSARSAWAVIAASAGALDKMAELAPAERSRAVVRLRALLDLAAQSSDDEDGVRAVARALRVALQNRAERRPCSAAPADLPDLRDDPRWRAPLVPGVSDIGSAVVEGYVAADHVDALVAQYLLVPSGGDANVVVHVLPAGMNAFDGSTLQAAADLAESWGPREERRACQLVRQLAAEQRGSASAT